MDAFYASVEQRDFPEYRGKPLAVGGSRERGVVAAASYEARKYGVKSAMSSKMAYIKCPKIIFTKPRFEVYKEVSGQIQEIFRSYTDLVEPLALDEAYLDVTQHKKGPSSATLIAKEIKAEILAETGLNASAGISINKFLAKVASDMDKPNGLYIILPNQVMPFIEQLKIEKFFGVGKVTAQKMHSLDIKVGKDLQRFSRLELNRYFGKSGSYYHNISHGIDNRPVRPNRIRKSVGAERTFEQNIEDSEVLLETLDQIAVLVAERMQKGNHRGKTIMIKIKYADFKVITRSKSVGRSISTTDEILPHSRELMNAISSHPLGIRLLGVAISNLDGEQTDDHGQLILEF